MGSVGDSCDNALAESIISLYKTEVIRHGGPWRNLEEVEFATLEWVAWFNDERLHSSIGYVHPRSSKAMYYAARESSTTAAGLN